MYNKVHHNRENPKPIYIKGDLLVKKRNGDDWFDHVIILDVTREFLEDIYELYTSDGEITKRTVEWVHYNYKRPDENEAP